MKKLLVLFLSAALVLSMAAVSMAAATVEGDWRVEYVDTDTTDLSYSLSDLRLNFKGKVSDTVDAYMQYTFGTKTALKEWYVTFNQSFGKVMAGDWDYKIHPSRVLVKSHSNLSVVPDDSAVAVLVEVPFADGFTFGLWTNPTMEDDFLAYDLKLAYKADNWGAEVHFGDNDLVYYTNEELVDDGITVAAYDSKYIGFDVYYEITDSIKVFAFATDADSTFSANGVDGLDPIIGVTFKEIAGSKLTASLEYDLEDEGLDYNRYGLQLKYAFNNKVALEVEYTNTSDDDNKLVIRPRVKF